MFDWVTVSLDPSKIRTRWQFGAMALAVWAVVALGLMYFDLPLTSIVAILGPTLIVMLVAMLLTLPARTRGTATGTRRYTSRQPVHGHQDDDDFIEDIEKYKEFLRFRESMRQSPELQTFAGSPIGGAEGRQKTTRGAGKISSGRQRRR